MGLGRINFPELTSLKNSAEAAIETLGESQTEMGAAMEEQRAAVLAAADGAKKIAESVTLLRQDIDADRLGRKSANKVYIKWTFIAAVVGAVIGTVAGSIIVAFFLH